jgi:IS30 family transposase
MSLIKEPKGVDFIIQSPPLTNQERKEISDFIASRKSEKIITKRIAKEKITVKK